MVNKIVSRDFNTDPEDNSENRNEKKELETLRKELAILQREKNNQAELKAIKFNSLLVLRQIREKFSEKEYLDYEGKINTSSSREEIEVIIKELLLKTKQKSVTSSNPVKENEDKKAKDKLAGIKRQNKILAEQLQLFSTEIEKLKREIQNLQKPGNQNKTLLGVVITTLTI